MLSLGLNSLESQTNFLTARIGPEGRADAVLVELRKSRVFIRKPMKSLGDYIRVSIGPQGQMEEFMLRFREVMDRVKST
jgi:histidinol-phosphate/aromatic aminotransferase/cobyric acid decarboxylase-like protein